MGTLTSTSRPVLNVSTTPTVVFGNRSLIWWGQILMMAIEGTMFAIFIASYFFYRTRVSDWPPGFNVPALKWGTLNVVLLLLSAAPNVWVKKQAEEARLRNVRLGLVLMGVIGIVNCAIRAFEFPALNCRWDSNAYGSMIWTLLSFHTFHLVTDTCDTLALTVLMFKGPLEGRRYEDVSVNAIYWYFIIGSAIATYVVIYWAPRWL
ncbi:MAG TPA: cytochrome c oxidase subunit 3 [Candidatus Angelobacter sp.]|nr:cytochrome c oxidase subunit 3 [Candidatus Angelobacter sp.]